MASEFGSGLLSLSEDGNQYFIVPKFRPADNIRFCCFFLQHFLRTFIIVSRSTFLSKTDVESVRISFSSEKIKFVSRSGDKEAQKSKARRHFLMGLKNVWRSTSFPTENVIANQDLALILLMDLLIRSGHFRSHQLIILSPAPTLSFKFIDLKRQMPNVNLVLPGFGNDKILFAQKSSSRSRFPSCGFGCCCCAAFFRQFLAAIGRPRLHLIASAIGG